MDDVIEVLKILIFFETANASVRVVKRVGKVILHGSEHKEEDENLTTLELPGIKEHYQSR